MGGKRYFNLLKSFFLTHIVDILIIVLLLLFVSMLFVFGISSENIGVNEADFMKYVQERNVFTDNECGKGLFSTILDYNHLPAVFILQKLFTFFFNYSLDSFFILSYILACCFVVGLYFLLRTAFHHFPAFMIVLLCLSSYVFPKTSFDTVEYMFFNFMTVIVMLQTIDILMRRKFLIYHFWEQWRFWVYGISIFIWGFSYNYFLPLFGAHLIFLIILIFFPKKFQIRQEKTLCLFGTAVLFSIFPLIYVIKNLLSYSSESVNYVVLNIFRAEVLLMVKDFLSIIDINNPLIMLGRLIIFFCFFFVFFLIRMKGLFSFSKNRTSIIDIFCVYAFIMFCSIIVMLITANDPAVEYIYFSTYYILFILGGIGVYAISYFLNALFCSKKDTFLMVLVFTIILIPWLYSSIPSYLYEIGEGRENEQSLSPFFQDMNSRNFDLKIYVSNYNYSGGFHNFDSLFEFYISGEKAYYSKSYCSADHRTPVLFPDKERFALIIHDTYLNQSLLFPDEFEENYEVIFEKEYAGYRGYIYEPVVLE